MKRISTFILAVALAGLTAGAASADKYDSRVDRSGYRQDARLRDGNMTRDEMRQVRALQNRIQMMERRAQADGHVSGWERARIQRAQNQLRQMIHRFQQDNGSRWKNGRSDDGRWNDDQHSNDRGWDQDGHKDDGHRDGGRRY